ncbi:glycosyltransferase family 4 protein [Tamlana sp. s12]|uniref:glycosyltransferase family 4 protein n=1 Tax=Tamlana sp. s12 TaxID=1630406 RepID=UPI0007FEA8F2|nr:glycosyltransferase family 4 protein [Tamlana sp. s12]OBQ54110.1 glycosyl transferase family 1 [Tamlana sp. s12]QQY81379.1 glycosyltransferase family 4 protein [Tamlana sp. s12]
MNKKIIRITTVPSSLKGLLKGQIKFMSSYYKMTVVSSTGGTTLEDYGISEGVKTIPVEMTRKITPFEDLKAVYKLYKIFKTEKPFIVHTHTPKAGTLGMLAAKLSGVPNRLHTIAGLPLVEASGLKRILLNAVEKITYSCATKIYPNSFGLETIILNHKFTNKKKLKVIANGSSNGIDTSYFDSVNYSNEYIDNLKNSLSISKSDYVFIFVGRLVTDKGINELIKAFNEFNKQSQNTKLLLIGPYENHLDPLNPETTDIINTNKNIISTGFVEDVRGYFAISNCLVFPSYREGFPNVVMQAGAMELPSIVSDINGCNEIIEHKKHGLIIPVKDEEAIQKAMIYIFKNQSEGKTMGKESRINIVSKYERQKVWDALLEEYNNL